MTEVELVLCSHLSSLLHSFLSQVTSLDSRSPETRNVIPHSDPPSQQYPWKKQFIQNYNSQILLVRIIKWKTRPVFCKQNGTSRLIFESHLSRSPKLQLILPSNPRPMIPYKCSIVTSAISLGHPVFQQMTLIWPFKVSKGQTDYATLFAIYDFRSVFYSNYSAISHGNPVFQQMTLIWPSKVT